MYAQHNGIVMYTVHVFQIFNHVPLHYSTFKISAMCRAVECWTFSCDRLQLEAWAGAVM